MIKADQDIYDAVIIGAGISGLVCGCYLAKSGMKVLIAEQHFKPGGYCTSFKRGKFTFDAAAHSFGGYRAGGVLNKILNELGVSALIQIKRYDPSDIVVSPDQKITFWADIDKTIHELQIAFPLESKKIHDFIWFLLKPQPGGIAALRKKTFGNLLDIYFSDYRLKAMLSLPVLGNGDLPPSLISAFSAAKIYSEFLLDGGYYPVGGMQSLPDALSEKFKQFGGKLLLSCRVDKIITSGTTVTGVAFQKGDSVCAKRVISNCDATQTFLKLLDAETLNKDFLTKLQSMNPSLSIFVLYLGLDNKYGETFPPLGTNVWFLPHYNIEALYLSAKDIKTELADYYMVRISPDGKTVLAFVNASFKDKEYWKTTKKDLLECFIKRIERNTIPNLSRYAVYKEAATPSTLQRYTLNHFGAAYGWAGTLDQFADSNFKKPSFINGLYLTGHWTTYAQGIPGVAYLGYDTATQILRRERTTN
jgi:phytoene dehydrogenase-like protein